LRPGRFYALYVKNVALVQQKVLKAIALALSVAACVFAQTSGKGFVPSIPKTWDDREIADLEVPLADASRTPKQISADYYYSIPVRKIYKSYTVYAPGKEPEGYQEWLKLQEPAVEIFDASRLKTEDDWIKAGEAIFDAPTFYDAVVRASDLQNPQWHAFTQPKAAKDGTLPYFRYVVREKGKVELGTVSCTMCHTRVMDDGTVIKGAQGNFPFDRASVFAISNIAPERTRLILRSLFGAPWVKPDPFADLDKMSNSQMAQWAAAIPAGVIARQGSSPLYPPQVPDLIDVKERRYLDHSGLLKHRSIVDMMRYAALNQGADDLASYGDFIPAARDFKTLPDPATRTRYSDEQLYAMSLYVYSLKAPANPNKFDALAARGQKVFSEQGCALCHTPPLYTNNKLTPADGFEVSPDHETKYDILKLSVGTDPRLTMRTRRGTGYYKVPSLKGVWYRGPFEHNGSVAMLEDWFDPKRLCDDYVPTGFRGAGVTTRAVKGHEFGMKLSIEDRKALIAFLKTL